MSAPRTPKLGLWAVSAVAASLALGAVPPPAAATVISSFSATTSPAPAQAGSHPDLTLSQLFTGTTDPKDLKVELPPGLVANPQVAPRCSWPDLYSDTCPPASAVGSVWAQVNYDIGSPGPEARGEVYNLEPVGSEVATLGVIPRFMSYPNTAPALIHNTVRPTDYGIDSISFDVPAANCQLNPWPCEPGPPFGLHTVTRIDLTLFGSVGGRPFVTVPTSCSPANVRLTANTYDEPDTFEVADSALTLTGCPGAVPFAPTVEVDRQDPAPGYQEESAGAPVGYTVGVSYPGYDESASIYESHLRRAEVTLPRGVALNPSVGDGLEGCTNDEFGYHPGDPQYAPSGFDSSLVECPGASKIGTASVETPLLDGDRSDLEDLDPPDPGDLDPLTGDVYFASPDTTDPPTELHPWRVFVVLEGGGARVKLQGETTIDQSTGQVKTIFDETPQTPFTRFELSLQGGEKAILRNPVDCGTHTMTSKLTPWSGGSDATPSDSIEVKDCPRPFAPTVAASAEPSQAGANSTSHLTIKRPTDQDKLIGRLNLALPPGAAGSLAAVPLCPADQIIAGSCSTDSRIGKIRTKVGTGTGLLDATGTLYLGQPTVAGDAASIGIVIPAKVGPIDLGQVVVVNSVKLRPESAIIDVESSDIPAILGGIPLAVKEIQIDIDRKGFFRNPTGCDPRDFVGSFTSTPEPSLGTPAEAEALDPTATATATAATQATGCEALDFSPKLRLIAGESGGTAMRSHPSLRAIVTQPDGQASIAKSVVTLPEILRPNVTQFNKPGALCQAAQLPACPALSQVGTATAHSPLLPQPLQGPVYIVQHPGNPLPKLAVMLGGMVSVQLNAQNSLKGVRTVNAFEGIPDVPVTSFELTVNGGPNGILNAFRDLCAEDSPQRGDSTFTGHNGKTSSSRPELEVRGCKPPSGIQILTGSTTVTRKGQASVKLRCLAESACKGRLTLQSAGKVRVSRKARRKKITLGRRSFSIASRSTSTVKIKLSRSAQRALRRAKRIRTRATAAPAVGITAFKPTTRSITVRAPRRR